MKRDATAPTNHTSLKYALTEDGQGSYKKSTISLTKPRKSSPKESKVSTIDSTLTEYACPICSNDLSSMKSTYMRQKHVENCIENSSNEHEESLEFNDCIFCGKILTHMNLTRRQIHLNACLDDTKEPGDTIEDEAIFAGRRMPFLETLSVCPVCNDSAPFNQRSLKQKVVHIKQCRKQLGMPMAQLLQKFRWVGWGHSYLGPSSNTPIETQTSPSTNSSASTQLNHEYQATNCPTYDDDDFSNNVVISRANQSLLRAQTSAKKEEMDDKLQMALALSRSLQTDNPQKRRTLKRTDERDWNSANIWSIEESRIKVFEKLDLILFPEKESSEILQQERERSVGMIGSSHLMKTIKHAKETYFWNLASNRELNWDNNFIFTSNFIQQFKSKRNSVLHKIDV